MKKCALHEQIYYSSWIGDPEFAICLRDSMRMQRSALFLMHSYQFKLIME
jgi:hypothetical protein